MPVDGQTPSGAGVAKGAEGYAAGDGAVREEPRVNEPGGPVKGQTTSMARFVQLIRNDLVHNTAALYGVQLCRKAIPLLTMPYLARVLGPAGWGSVAFVSSLGEFIVLIIEFGFNLSATR